MYLYTCSRSFAIIKKIGDGYRGSGGFIKKFHPIETHLDPVRAFLPGIAGRGKYFSHTIVGNCMYHQLIRFANMDG